MAVLDKLVFRRSAVTSPLEGEVAPLVELVELFELVEYELLPLEELSDLRGVVVVVEPPLGRLPAEAPPLLPEDPLE